MIIRPRRLRSNEFVRKMSRETRVSKESLVLPIFVASGKNILEDIPSLEGQKRYSVDTISRKIEESLKAGVHNFMIFGIPETKDELGYSAYDEFGVVQETLRTLKKNFGKDAYLITDVCLCEYTSHGHCGVIKNDSVENDSTLELLEKTALSHVLAGADMVAPSDMMDGRVLGIRSILDSKGFVDVPIMSYSAKYSSAFYGPFREAAGSCPQFGDRKSYQMDYHNSKEAIKEILLDEQEGADILMVKPALSYLDIISQVSSKTNLPLAAYSVSGEYAMIKAASKAGFVDEYSLMCETAVSIFRAGAGILISYFSEELAKAIERGDIG